MQDNKEVYSTVEFGCWADRQQLEPSESILIRRYLDPGARTLEAGTGGGRILLAMQAMGYRNLTGFDFVADLIRRARERDAHGEIRFDVEDATSLPYADGAFDQIIYMQQILSLIESPAMREKALAEALRVIRPGGVALFSFLSFEARSRSAKYRPLLAYLRGLRAVRGAPRSMQELPWLRLGDRFNWAALRDASPYVYWFRMPEAAALLERGGFRLAAIGSGHQVEKGEMAATPAELEGRPLTGMLYCVATRPA